MQAINQAIQSAYAAYRRGDHDAARRELAPINHPKAIHLLALVEKEAGNLERAAVLLDRAAAADPGDFEIANNQGNVARRLGRTSRAEDAYRRALSLKPGFQQAEIGLGRLLIDAGRYDEARPIYEHLLRTAPGSVAARYGAATVDLALGDAEGAEDRFTELIEGGGDSAECRYMRARARLELGRTAAAIPDLQASFAAKPSPIALKTLAGALWMTGERDAFETLLSAAAQTTDLAVSAAELYRQSGQPERALAVLADVRARGKPPADARWIAAMAHVDAGDPETAEAEALACLEANPAHRLVYGSLISALLMQGKAAEAMTYIRQMREAEPHGQHWIGYEATALRLLGSPDYEALVDMERFVRPYTLPTPPGYASLEEFNAALLAALDKWHGYKTHPLDQSLRHGSQTPRSLANIPDPVIQTFLRALDEPIRRYMEAVGTGDEHPLTRRNVGDYRISGCWSVRLHGGGRHVSHVHPEGWISSAYYVAVPGETRSDPDRAGWIKFGEPPFATVPETPAEKWICPEPGLLVLFPSFLWHGTEAIHDGAVRVTAPFDVVPSRERDG